MDLPKYLSLLSSSSLWLARSNTFKDKSEGIFHEAMRVELEAIYDDFNANGKISQDESINSTEEFQRYLLSNTYINCWHENQEENMVMWEIYGQRENSVAIRTTAENLKESINVKDIYKNDALEIALDKVDYLSRENLPSERNYRQPFFIKRPHYKFENEVRLYILARNKQTPGNAPFGYKVKTNLVKLIDEVYVHPDAEDWFFETVADVTHKYGLVKDVRKGKHGNKF
jgi:hypothetical protein